MNEDDLDYRRHTCFSDESRFMLTSAVNRNHYWSHLIRDHLLLETYAQTQQKVNVWAEILGSHIVEPSFNKGDINRDTYLNILQECVESMFTDILETDDNLGENEITGWFTPTFQY